MSKEAVRVHGNGALLTLLAFLGGCASPLGAPPPRKPLRYLVIEKRVAELFPGGRIGDGQVDPEAQQLVLHPLYREDLEWELAVRPAPAVAEVVMTDPPGPVTPGQILSVRVRVKDAEPGASYRLIVRPGSAPLRVLGPTSRVVRGKESCVFCFTSLQSGKVWIGIDVVRLWASQETGPLGSDGTMKKAAGGDPGRPLPRLNMEFLTSF